MRTESKRLYKMTLVSLFTALTIVGASIQIPLPITPVPITLQTLFVILAGMLLGAKAGGLSQLLFLAAGLVFPVYASRQVGVSAVLHPSFGFVVGFVFAALVVGFLMQKISSPTPVRLFFVALAGTVVIYAVGVFHVVVVLRWLSGTGRTFGTVLSVFFLPYVVGDILKCVAAALAVPPILRAVGAKLPFLARG